MVGIEECVSSFIRDGLPTDNAYALEDHGSTSPTYGFVEYRTTSGVLHRVSIWITPEDGCNILDLPVEG